MRLHWIGTISGRAPPPDALPCTAPASKSGQGRWVVREEERGEVICCGQGTEQRGGGRRTINSAPGKCTKTATSKRTCFSNALPHTSNGGSGKRAARERSEGEKSPELPGCTGRGGTQRVGVAAEMNMWEMLMSADSPTLHRAHTRRASKQARGVGM